jgi:DNA (cytosine-5)-methyltransferase 1
MGGLSLAAQYLGMRVVAGVDTNSDALRTYKKNFPDAVIIEKTIMGSCAINDCKDTLQLYNKIIAPIIIVSGPPCQGFSVAGSHDHSDKRNKVLLAVGRAIVRLKPQAALIENVASLLESKHAERVRKFKKGLQKAGYSVLTLSLNAKDYGVPQKRKRAFFLVSKAILDEKKVKERLNELKIEEVSVREAFRGLPSANIRPEKYIDKEDTLATPNHYAMKHSLEVRRKIAAIQPGTGPMSYRKLHPDRPANTLFSGHRAPPAHFRIPRSITVREAARLQGFPDSFRILGSFSKQMEQVTNAVPPPLAKAVLRVLAEQNSLCINP